MRLATLVDHVPEKDVRRVLGMQRVDLGVRRLGEILVLVALNRLAEERKTNQENQRERDPQPAPVRSGYAGFHRRTGLRAAVTSSTRLVRVPCGAFLTICGSVSISLAIEIMASMNWSSSCLPSVSVGSIISAPWTISGKLTVYGWKP